MEDSNNIKKLKSIKKIKPDVLEIKDIDGFYKELDWFFKNRKWEMPLEPKIIKEIIHRAKINDNKIDLSKIKRKQFIINDYHLRINLNRILNYSEIYFIKEFINYYNNGIRFSDTILNEPDMIEPKNIRIKKRAEDFTYKEILSQKCRELGLSYYFDNYNLYHKNPLFILGEKGIGKTFNVLHYVLNEFVKKGHITNGIEYFMPKTPTVIMFKKNNKLQLYKPIEGKIYDNVNFDKIKEHTGFLIIDDIHYLCESVINGHTPVETLTDALTFAIKHHKESHYDDVKTVIISEDMLSAYSEVIKDKELYELLPELGDYSHTYAFSIGWKEADIYKKRQKHLSFHHIAPPTNLELALMLNELGIGIGEVFTNFIMHNANGNPRAVINVITEMGLEKKDERKIDDKEFVEFCTSKLNTISKSNLLQLCKFPKLNVKINHEKLKLVLNDFPIFSDFERYMLSVKNEIKIRIYTGMSYLKEKYQTQIYDISNKRNRYTEENQEKITNKRMIVDKIDYLLENIRNYNLFEAIYEYKHIQKIRNDDDDNLLYIADSPYIRSEAHPLIEYISIYYILMIVKKEVCENMEWLYPFIYDNYTENGFLNTPFFEAFKDVLYEDISDDTYRDFFNIMGDDK